MASLIKAFVIGLSYHECSVFKANNQKIQARQDFFYYYLSYEVK